MAVQLNEPRQIYHSCSSCDRETWQTVLFSKTITGDPEYRIDELYEVLQCCGCHGISFRKVVQDIEAAYPINEDEWEVPEDIFSYPRILKGHRALENIWSLPNAVKDIYTQSIQAIKEDSNILAGIGMRACIEAICNDRDIKGKTLDKRIDALAKVGLISQKDAERLHAIRFLGNDAAHEIKNATQKNLLIALRIIDHLLINIYILDDVTDGKLETIIRTPESFVKLLNQKIKEFSSGDQVPLAKIFGKDMRRFHGYFAEHEKYLIDSIGNGQYLKLAVGKIDVYASSKEKVQLFSVL
jgi:hypothetical protein